VSGGRCDPLWQVTLRSSEMTCSGELYPLTFSLTIASLNMVYKVSLRIFFMSGWALMSYSVYYPDSN